MTVEISPLLWVAVFMAAVVALDQNVEDWISVKVAHLIVWLQTQQMKRQLLREIRSIERDKDRYLDLAKQIIEEQTTKEE